LTIASVSEYYTLPYTTLFRSRVDFREAIEQHGEGDHHHHWCEHRPRDPEHRLLVAHAQVALGERDRQLAEVPQLLQRREDDHARSEEHTSELQSPDHLVCRLL